MSLWRHKHQHSVSRGNERWQACLPPLAQPQHSRPAGQDALDSTQSSVDQEAQLPALADRAGGAGWKEAPGALRAEALPRFVFAAGAHASIRIGSTIGVRVDARLTGAGGTAATGTVVAAGAGLADGAAGTGPTAVDVTLVAVLDAVAADEVPPGCSLPDRSLLERSASDKRPGYRRA